jgi:hypothetical protein
MFPDDSVALDVEGFNDYLTSKFLKTAHLFNDIKNSYARDLHTYHI